MPAYDTDMTTPSPLSMPPVVPETFEDVSRAMVLLKARTIPGRLDDNGLVVLKQLLGALPSADEAGAWRDHLTERLLQLRAEGLEPPEPPRIPAATKKLSAAIRLIDKAATPEGIASRGQRLRLYHLLGGVFPNAETAQVWRKVLEEHRDKLIAAREQREAASAAATPKAATRPAPKPRKTATSELKTVVIKPSTEVAVATRRRPSASGKFRR